MTTSLRKSLRTDTANWTYPTIQPTIAHLNQETRPLHNDQNHFPIGSLNSCIDVPRSRRNIDNRTRMNPQLPIITITPDSSKAINRDIFDPISKTLDISYRGTLWHVTKKCED